MIKNNKVINSVLLPKVLLPIVLIALTTSVGVYVAQEKISTAVHTKKPGAWLTGIVAALIVCICMDVYSDYKKSEKFASLIARKYLKNEIKKQPELKQFQKILNDPKAMQNISSLIFNSLRPSERKCVAQIILDMRQKLKNDRKYNLNYTESLINIKKLLNNARDEIVSVLQEHASVHPEFMRDIYSAMVSADNTIYIMSKINLQQHTK